MLKFVRAVFAVVMMAVVATVLVLATLSWADSYRAQQEEVPPAVELAER